MDGAKKMFRNYSKGNYTNKIKYNVSKKTPTKRNKKKQFKKALNSECFNRELEYIKTIEEHNQPINNIISLDNINYITSDHNEFYIRNLENNNTLKDNFGQDSKIHKIIYSSGKMIFSVAYTNQINGNNEKGIYYKLNLAMNINNQMQLFSCNINDNPNVILDINNIIITAWNNFIELFQLIKIIIIINYYKYLK